MRQSTGDILLDWHPLLVSRLVCDAVGIAERSYKDTAEILGVRVDELKEIVDFPHVLTPDVAVNLHKVGLDGEDLFRRQNERRLEIARRYANGELERPYARILEDA